MPGHAGTCRDQVPISSARCFPSSPVACRAWRAMPRGTPPPTQRSAQRSVPGCRATPAPRQQSLVLWLLEEGRPSGGCRGLRGIPIMSGYIGTLHHHPWMKEGLSSLVKDRWAERQDHEGHSWVSGGPQHGHIYGGQPRGSLHLTSSCRCVL